MGKCVACGRQILIVVGLFPGEGEALRFLKTVNFNGSVPRFFLLSSSEESRGKQA